MFNRLLTAPPGAVFLQTEKRNYSYQWLRDKISRISGLFSARGLQPGDRLMLTVSNEAEMSALFISALMNRITVVQADPEAKQLRVQSIVRRTSPSLVIADSESLDAWGLPAEWKTLALRAEKSVSAGILGKFLKKKTDTFPENDYFGQLQEAPQVSPQHTADDQELAYIIFTSGTTAESKGVAITHGNLRAHLATLVRVYGLTAESAILNTLYLSHADGSIQGPVLAAVAGCTWHKPFRFSIERIPEYLDYIYANGISHVFAVPAMLNMMLQFSSGSEDSFQYPEFRALLSVSAHLENTLWERFEQLFRIQVSNVYGLTETVAGSLFCTPVSGIYRRFTAGKPVDCELRITSDDFADLGPGEAGKLWLRGKHIMPAYWNDPDATGAAFHDDWLRTGDIAEQDADGFIRILGRKKNLVISGGFNIQPEEVAECLLMNPAVSEAVAFGQPDAVFGEKLAAAVTLKSGYHITGSEIINDCRKILEERKLPGQVFIVTELPKGVSGKVSLPAIKQMIRDLNTAPLSPRTGDNEAEILQVAAGAFQVPVSKISMSDTSRTIAGWDSLAHLDFITSLEARFQVRFNTAEVITMNSLRRAAELIGQKNA